MNMGAGRIIFRLSDVEWRRIAAADGGNSAANKRRRQYHLAYGEMYENEDERRHQRQPSRMGARWISASGLLRRRGK